MLVRKTARPPALATLLRFSLAAVFLFTARGAPAQVFVRGQVNEDAQVDISDAISLLSYLFGGGPAPGCLKAADSNDDGEADITDAVYLLDYLFLSGTALPPPFPEAGADRTPDGLSCVERPLTGFQALPGRLALSRPGESRQLQVTGLVGGVPARLEEAAGGTSYQSANPAVAFVYRDGLVEGIGAGTTAVSVQHAGLEATVEVTVSAGGTESYRLLAANDLGMHCIDREFSVYSILPPFNVINAQVVRRGSSVQSTQLIDAGSVTVTYSPAADSGGSINSTSSGKTGFWDHWRDLFRVTLEPLQGLLGLFLPADAPQTGPQPFSYDANRELFTAAGIPIIDRDDSGRLNPFPLLRIAARDRVTGAVLAANEVVVPVSSETDCQNCHLTGGRAAKDPAVAWSDDPDLEIQTKMNVLTLHDLQMGTDLLSQRPVLCAKCHYSKALDLAGSGPQGVQLGRPHFTRAMHGFHGKLLDESQQPLFPAAGDALATCYQCHPGRVTQCLRGAMKNGGLQCRDCHGSMLSVAGEPPLLPEGSIDGTNDGRARRGWTDLPRCQSCHTGDALSHLEGADLVLAPDGIRLLQAYRQGDLSASPLAAPASRFAENGGTLYRFSKGHGGIACQGCHGSTHAEWPHADPAASDNLAAQHLQGHAGPVTECGACHAASLSLSLDGPHGLHPVGDARWVHQHEVFFERSPESCRPCHGENLLGTVLSRVAVDRTFQVEGRTVSLKKGTQVACNLCHGLPGGDE